MSSGWNGEECHSEAHVKLISSRWVALKLVFILLLKLTIYLRYQYINI